MESEYSSELGAQARFWNPTTTPSGRISNELEGETERKKKNAIHSGHLRFCLPPKGRASTLLGQKTGRQLFQWAEKK
jgi:hypothetical protein